MNGEYTMTPGSGLEQRNIIALFRHQISEATLIRPDARGEEMLAEG